MIVDYIQNLYRYMGINANLDKALDYLLSHTVNDIDGRIDIYGQEVYVSKQKPTLVPYSARGWENHFSYLDIHVAVEGCETIWFLNTPDDIKWTDIRKENDCELSYDNVEATGVFLKPGMCVILWPGEPHKPNTGEGVYTKLVVKVKMN